MASSCQNHSAGSFQQHDMVLVRNGLNDDIILVVLQLLQIERALHTEFRVLTFGLSVFTVCINDALKFKFFQTLLWSRFAAVSKLTFAHFFDRIIIERWGHQFAGLI